MSFSRYWTGSPITVATLVGLAFSGPLHAQSQEKVVPAYSAVGSGISYYNTPNRSHTTIDGKEAKTLATAVVTLDKPADVLVQFTSQLATVTSAGCPCSVRATLAVDGKAGIVVKRVNLTGGSGTGAAYIPDRQPADGSFVFPLPAGKHEIVLAVQQIDGSAESLQSFYANLQALIFPH